METSAKIIMDPEAVVNKLEAAADEERSVAAVKGRAVSRIEFFHYGHEDPKSKEALAWAEVAKQDAYRRKDYIFWRHLARARKQQWLHERQRSRQLERALLTAQIAGAVALVTALSAIVVASESLFW